MLAEGECAVDYGRFVRRVLRESRYLLEQCQPGLPSGLLPSLPISAQQCIPDNSSLPAPQDSPLRPLPLNHTALSCSALSSRELSASLQSRPCHAVPLAAVRCRAEVRTRTSHRPPTR